MTPTQTPELTATTDHARTAPRSGPVARRFRLALAAASVVLGIVAGTAGPASATTVSWPNGGSHDQSVSCDSYNHRMSVSISAAAMFYYHAGQYVSAIVMVKDTASTTWTTYSNYPVRGWVYPTYLPDPILGASGTEYDWEYPMRNLGALTVSLNAGRSYQVYVYYYYYNAGRVVAVDGHATDNYQTISMGSSGRLALTNYSTVSCKG
jgi:hypothetical protein